MILADAVEKPGASVGEARARHRRDQLPCTPDLTIDVVLAARVLEAAMRDRTYQQTKVGRDVATYLEWKSLKVKKRSLVVYELYLAGLCLHVAAVDPTTAE